MYSLKNNQKDRSQNADSGYIWVDESQVILILSVHFKMSTMTVYFLKKSRWIKCILKKNKHLWVSTRENINPNITENPKQH